MVSCFHEDIAEALVRGALQALIGGGITAGNIRRVSVPGAFELPIAAASVIRSWHPDAVVALGCLVKGQTPQYAAIGTAVAQGLTQVAVSTATPVTFGVIIAESFQQARARARLMPMTSHEADVHRGREAALAALAMLQLRRTLARTRTR